MLKFEERELEKIAEDLRIRITSGRAVTIDDYVNLAKSKKGDALGLFNLWVARQNAELGTYFPKEVFHILKEKKGVHYFSSKERDFIRENSIHGVLYLAWSLNVPPHSVHKQAHTIGVSIARRDYEFYSIGEVKLIRAEGLNETDLVLSDKLIVRTPSSIQHKRLSQGIKKRGNFKWEDFPDKENYILQYHGKKLIKEIASDLSLSHSRVEKRITQFILEGKLRRTDFSWDDNPEKEAYLIREYGKISYREIADNLGLRYFQVSTKIARLLAEGKLFN
jgi:hypothetical protein